jgi:hypothetical protein
MFSFTSIPMTSRPDERAISAEKAVSLKPERLLRLSRHWAADQARISTA